MEIHSWWLNGKRARLRKFGWWLPDENAIAVYRSIFLYYFVIVFMWKKED